MSDGRLFGRRQMLTITGTVGATLLAGCSSSSGGSPTETSTQTTTNTQTETETPETTSTPTETTTETTMQTQTTTVTPYDNLLKPKEYENMVANKESHIGNSVNAYVKYITDWKEWEGFRLITQGDTAAYEFLLTFGSEMDFSEGDEIQFKGTVKKFTEVRDKDVPVITINEWEWVKQSEQSA